MVSSQLDELPTPRALAELLPASVSKVEQYFGSFVRINFDVTGFRELELRIYLADWVALNGQAIVADSSRSPSENDKYFSLLNGIELLDIKASNDAEIRLLFSGGLEIRVVANLKEYELEDELLVIYLDDVLIKFFVKRGFVSLPPARTEH